MHTNDLKWMTAVGVLCAVWLAGCHRAAPNTATVAGAASNAVASPNPNVNATPALTVEVTAPDGGGTVQVLDTSGGLFAWQEVAVGADVSGYRVSEVFVDVGDSVQKGQVLAKLDDALLRQSVLQAQAAVEEAKATLEQTQAAARRGEALQKSGLISKQDLETLNTNAATATARLNSATAQLQAANQKLDYATIHAPDGGVISERSVAPGQIANAGANLFKLIRQSRVEWRAEIPASELGKVRRGMTASITRADGTKATGVVRTVSPGLDTNTQRGLAYVDLKLEPLVRPGMYVTGAIHLARAKTLTVPLAAVSVRDGFSYVFVLQPDRTVRQQRVTVGQLLNDTIEVRDGLSSDDRIVATGAGFLHDGDVVRLGSGAATASTQTSSSSAKAPAITK